MKLPSSGRTAYLKLVTDKTVSLYVPGIVDTTMHRIEAGKWILNPHSLVSARWDLKELYLIEDKLETLLASRVNEVMFDDM